VAQWSESRLAAREFVSLTLLCAPVAHWSVTVWAANNCDSRHVAVLRLFLFTELGGVYRPTQLFIPPGSVNEDQLRLRRQRQVWFIPFVHKHVGCRWSCKIIWQCVPYLSAPAVRFRHWGVRYQVYYLYRPIFGFSFKTFGSAASAVLLHLHTLGPYTVISLEAVVYSWPSSYCNTVEWFWWDWSLSQWPTGFFQCFDAVGRVIWPVKIVPEMTYKVSSGTWSLYTLTRTPTDIMCRAFVAYVIGLTVFVVQLATV